MTMCRDIAYICILAKYILSLFDWLYIQTYTEEKTGHIWHTHRD